MTTVPKKGCKTELKNQRGIFRCPVVRSILMRLIYNLKYPVIDKNMSDCQKSVTLQVTDYEQMFYAIDLEEAISDLFDAGVDDDALVMIHKANEEVHMAVKTGGGGLTEREVIRDSVLQGDTFLINSCISPSRLHREGVSEDRIWILLQRTSYL